MRKTSVSGIAVTFSLTAGSLTGCLVEQSPSSLPPEAEAILDNLEERIPTRDRASVRICEELIVSELRNEADALDFVTWGLQELNSSDDPRGMFIALGEALVGLGDALVLQDQTSYSDAAINLATTCTDIVSGEYGQ